MSLRKTAKIFDKNISFENFATFRRCQIIHHGLAVRFVFTCGALYDIPIEYLLQWAPHPHYAFIKGELKNWEEVGRSFDYREGIMAVKCKRILSRTGVHIYFSDNAVYEIPWDTVLMACEPRYEHFGGLTDTSKNIVAEWHNKLRENSPEVELYVRKLRLRKPQHLYGVKQRNRFDIKKRIRLQRRCSCRH